MKKLLSLLGAAGLLLAAGSSVMSFSYVNQPVSTTTVVNSTLVEAKNINEVITTTDLGVVGDLDARLVKGENQEVSMNDDNLLALVKEVNPTLKGAAFEGRLHVEANGVWDAEKRVVSTTVSLDGYEGNAVVTFWVPKGVWEIVDKFYTGAFITQRANGQAVTVTDSMVLNRWYALNQSILPKTVKKADVHYKSFSPQRFGEITIDNFSGRYTIVWWGVDMPNKIISDLKVKTGTEQGVIDAFKEANPSLRILLNNPSVVTAKILSRDLATITVKAGNDLLLYAAVLFQVA